MCVIAAKPAGVKFPGEETLNNMFWNNPDGAGYMYAEKGVVYIQKGLMTRDDFGASINRLKAKKDLDKLPMVMHFRITTHGGTKPENTHPFPVTESVGALQKRKMKCSLGVAHNGIIDITPRKGISDTMEYVVSQLGPLYKAVPKFYENKDLMRMVSNAIDSKMAFLTGAGKIYTIGSFTEDSGIKYSNQSFKYPRSFTQYSIAGYGSWEDDVDFVSGRYAYKQVMWFDSDEVVVVTPSGEVIECPYDFAMDKEGKIYSFSISANSMKYMPGYRAYDQKWRTPRWDENLVSVEATFAANGK